MMRRAHNAANLVTGAVNWIERRRDLGRGWLHILTHRPRQTLCIRGMGEHYHFVEMRNRFIIRKEAVASWNIGKYY